MSRLIVLGAGFLGTAISAASADRLPTTTVDPPFDTTLAQRDARATDALRVLVDRGPEDEDVLVINACGRITGTRAELHDANVGFVEWLCDALSGTGARLVHVGSASELGDPGTAARVDESWVPSPVGDYAETKAEGTEVVTRAAASGLDALTARVFNVVGTPVPPSSPMSGWLTELAALPVGGGPVDVWWPPTTRDFVHVDDVASSLVDLALRRPSDDAAAAPLVNVCTGIGLSFGDIVAALAVELDKEVEVRSLERPGIECVIGDPTLLVELTGRAPTMTLERLARAIT